MVKPEDTDNEGQKSKEIVRSNVLYEAWVGDPNNPLVYLLLLHKKSANWWEVPGGKIERELTKPYHLLLESLREFEEEAPIDSKPISSQSEPLDFQVSGHLHDLVMPVYEGNATIKSAKPHLLREGFDSLPAINLSSNDAEHDGYIWIDVTDMHADQIYSTSPLVYSSAPRRGISNFYEAIAQHQPKSPFPPVHGDILSIPNLTNINLSSVAKRVLNLYAAHAIEKDPPTGFKRPKRL